MSLVEIVQERDGAEVPSSVREAPARLSESSLWEFQRRFFQEQGIEAWRQGTVPHYVTSNSFLARSFSQMAMAFLWDLHRSPNSTLDPNSPIYILELGSGCGRFAYHFLRHLLPQLRSVSSEVRLPVRYVMTDLSRPLIDYWRGHERLQEFVEAGSLDFALFDASHPQDIHLLSSDEVLKDVTNPLIVISNYFFDSIEQDCFWVDDDNLYEVAISISSTPQNVDESSLVPAELSWALRPVESRYYDDEALELLLSIYRERPDRSFLIPVAALRCLRHLHDLSQGRLLLLSADKGEVDGLGSPGKMSLPIVWHGSFSLPVNFHALGEYARALGGTVLHPESSPAHLVLAAYLFGDDGEQFPQSKQVYRTSLAVGGPDDLFTLKSSIVRSSEHLRFEELVAFIRLCGWDSKVFLDLFNVLSRHVSTLSDKEQAILWDTARKVWEHYYPIGESSDLAFHLGVLMCCLENYLEAISYFERSMEWYGPDASVDYAVAFCHARLGNATAATRFLNSALNRDLAFLA